MISAVTDCTFEEDKFAIVAFVGGVDVIGQTVPEHRYGHGVAVQNTVPEHTPEPSTLEEKD